MSRINAFLLVAASLVAATPALALQTETRSIGMAEGAFSADEGCSVVLDGLPAAIRENPYYLAPPAPGQDWPAWLDALDTYRQRQRATAHDAGAQLVLMRFDGVRAWIRTSSDWAFAADLLPGQWIELQGQARWLEGNNKLCAALDWLDRPRQAGGTWQGWSGVLASTSFPKDGRWHEFRIPFEIPPFDTKSQWARPILGMDGTFDKQASDIQLRHLKLAVPADPRRAGRFRQLAASHKTNPAYNDAIYRRADLAWMTRNFVCGFVFIYDRSFWDPGTRSYQVEALCDSARREFGGYDSVVLWHAYPRIGADDRNQFDFYRGMPGGIHGLRGVVDRFHRQNVKVFLAYNPWDTGTRRPEQSDEQSFATLVAELDADGVFGDTMIAAPKRLRQAVDAVRPGVAFEPEGHPSLLETEHSSGSWAQWLTTFPEIGVLRLKWIEPRHMQHQIHRWDRSHQDELAAAWLNGSGIFVWENVFASWNPWNANDRAALRRMTPILRQFASHFSDGRWLPYYPTLVDRVYASCWQHQGTTLWTYVNRTGASGSKELLDVDDSGQQFFDLWHGVPITPRREGHRLRLTVDLDRFGAIVSVPRQREESIRTLIAEQRAEAARPVASDGDAHMHAKSVISPRKPPRCPAARPETITGALEVAAGKTQFTVRHVRRECGCYPDADCPPAAQWDRFLAGTPFEGTIEHRVTVSLSPYWIDPKPVTNAQYETFLKATGYSPKCRDRFLDHWGGKTCPPKLKDQPVVYVDLDDARAYAAWAGKRLPTEWQWHQAARQYGDRFSRDIVHEWTETERDDGHTRFVMLRGGCKYRSEGSIWYFPGGPQPIDSHAKFLLLDSGLDRCATIGFRCVTPKDPVAN